jgi:hypothetical protein
VGHAYDTASLLPGSPESWGVILLCAAVFMASGMFTGKRWLFQPGLFIGMLWNFFFALSFLKEFVDIHTDDVPGSPLGLGPFITYLFISGLFALRISTYKEKNAAPTDTP